MRADGTRYVTAKLTTEQFERFRALCDRNHVSAFDVAADAIVRYCDVFEAAEVKAVERLAGRSGRGEARSRFDHSTTIRAPQAGAARPRSNPGRGGVEDALGEPVLACRFPHTFLFVAAVLNNNHGRQA